MIATVLNCCPLLTKSASLILLQVLIEHVSCQGLTLWMQYMTLLGGINIPFPNTVHWVFSAVSFAFATVTSGSLSVDCLLNVHAMNPALQRVLWHLAIPVFSLMVLALVQLAW